MICSLCPHHCELSEGQTGFCRARANIGGSIICRNYGHLTSLALDPVEKKPLKRFHPGSYLLSAGSYGCNMRCPFCQNSDISMADDHSPTVEVMPEALAAKAVELIPKGNIGIAYTYNEPLVGYEYVRDCARLAREAGLVNVVVTNGMICEQPLDELLPLIDAMNIDLKGFTQACYDQLKGDLATVQTAIVHAAKACHVEVTTLIVPQLNDREEEMEAEAAWLATISPELPLHISRFFPRYHMADRQPTPIATIHRLMDIAKKHLRLRLRGQTADDSCHGTAFRLFSPTGLKRTTSLPYGGEVVRLRCAWHTLPVSIPLMACRIDCRLLPFTRHVFVVRCPRWFVAGPYRLVRIVQKVSNLVCRHAPVKTDLAFAEISSVPCSIHPRGIALSKSAQRHEQIQLHSPQVRYSGRKVRQVIQVFLQQAEHMLLIGPYPRRTHSLPVYRPSPSAIPIR